MFFDLAFSRDVRLYEQSLSECNTNPDDSHTVIARLQMISNLEAQLVHSAASIQNMEMKANVVKSLKPDDRNAEEQLQNARSKMENIRQQLETIR